MTEPSSPALIAIWRAGDESALRTISTPVFWSSFLVRSPLSASTARSSATPPPGKMPSSTAARVACIASSTRSLRSFTSTSVAQPTRITGATTTLKIPAPEDLLARRGLGHRIPARIADVCHVRFYAGSDTAGARLNTRTQFRDVGLAHLSGHRHREQAVLTGWRKVVQMRFYAGLDPAFAGLNAGTQCLDVAGAGLACLLCHCDRT